MVGVQGVAGSNWWLEAARPGRVLAASTGGAPRPGPPQSLPVPRRPGCGAEGFSIYRSHKKGTMVPGNPGAGPPSASSRRATPAPRMARGGPSGCGPEMAGGQKPVASGDHQFNGASSGASGKPGRSCQLKGTDHGNCSFTMKPTQRRRGRPAVGAWEGEGVSRNAKA